MIGVNRSAEHVFDNQYRVMIDGVTVYFRYYLTEHEHVRIMRVAIGACCVPREFWVYLDTDRLEAAAYSSVRALAEKATA
jgi:hypothetical protein